MQIKFCDNICGVRQGPILRPILSNASINRIEHSLSKLADDTRLRMLLVLLRKGIAERDSDRLQECAPGNLHRQGPAPGRGQCPESEQAG